MSGTYAIVLPDRFSATDTRTIIAAPVGVLDARDRLRVVLAADGTRDAVLVLPGDFDVAAPSGAKVIVSMQGPPGPPGPPGPEGSPVVVRSLVAVSSVTISHGYAYPPSVRLIDGAGRSVLCQAEYADSQHVHIAFPVPFTGTAILS